MQLSTRVIETKLSELRDQYSRLGDELRSKQLHHAGLSIAISIVQEILDGDGEAEAAIAEVVPRRAKRLTHTPAEEPKVDRRRGPKLERRRPFGKGRTAENGDRDAKIMAKLNAGVSARQVAEEFGVSVPTIYNVKSRASGRASKPAKSTASNDDDDGPADDHPPPKPEAFRPSEAPLKQPSFLDDSPLSPIDRELKRKAVELLLKDVRRLTAQQIVSTCKLGPKQFEQVAAVANIERDDEGRYQIKRRF